MILIQGTIEEKIFQRQVKKTGLSGSVLDSDGLTDDAGLLLRTITLPPYLTYPVRYRNLCNKINAVYSCGHVYA